MPGGENGSQIGENGMINAMCKNALALSVSASFAKNNLEYFKCSLNIQQFYITISFMSRIIIYCKKSIQSGLNSM